jgi:MIP family channel proteins
MATASQLANKMAKFDINKWFFKKDKLVDILVPSLAEFVASAFFVFLACGAGMNTVNFAFYAGSVQVQISLAFGFMITALAFAIGHLSGGHINCAVTFAFVVSGRISPLKGLGYFLGQLFGGIVGAICLKALMPQSFWPSCFAANFVQADAPGTAFLLELVLTFFLLFVVSSATDSTKQLKDLTPLAVGLCIYCCHMVGVPVTGTSINPTRSFASAVVSTNVPGCENVWQYHWIFWFAPLLGGAMATYVYQFAFAQAWGESLEGNYKAQEPEAGLEAPTEMESYDDAQFDGQAHDFGEEQEQETQQ